MAENASRPDVFSQQQCVHSCVVVKKLLSQDVCSGKSGHAEVVLLEYDPDVVAYEELLEIFWKTHDPTQVSGTLP